MSSQRVAVVTGSNKGIGFSIIRALCKQLDGDVYLTSRDEGRGKKAVEQLESEGLKPKFHLLDILDQKSIDTLKDYFLQKYGGVDIFIHNAAIAYKGADPAPFSEQATVTINANFTSTLNLGHAFLPIMRAEGRYVNMSSFVAGMTLAKCNNEVATFFKSSDLTEEALIAKMQEFVDAAQSSTHVKKGFADTAYGMSKLGVSALTRIQGKQAKLLKIPNVLVNCSDPGWVKTDMAGESAKKTPDEGAETSVYLALLPKGSSEPNGEYFSEKKLVKWYV